MKKRKKNICAVLIFALCLGGSGLSSLFTLSLPVLSGKVVSYAKNATDSQLPATLSFMPSDRTDIEFYSYYTRTDSNKARYLDRNGERQYRIYGTPPGGSEDWYVADENYEPGRPAVRVEYNDEFMNSAPFRYHIYGPGEKETADHLPDFLAAHQDFRNGTENELAEVYNLDWDPDYIAPYQKADPENVYGVSGAFALKRKTEEAAIYYIVYGRIENDGTSGTDRWFLFEENTGYRYRFTYQAGANTGTVIGAVKNIGDEVRAPGEFSGYHQPEGHILEDKASGEFTDFWEFIYAANSSTLATYSYSGRTPSGMVKMTDLTYDRPARAEQQACHSGYRLKYYCCQETFWD